MGGEPFRVVPGAAVPGCASVAPASLSPVLLVSDRPSVSFGEWQRGSPCKGSFFSGAGPGRGKLAGGWGVRAAGSPRRCCPPHPSAGAFSAVLGQARAREWPFSGLPRRARAGRRPETELAAWGGARGAGEGASSSRSPCVPPRTSFRGQRTEVAGGGHCGVLGCLLARDAPLLLFSPTSFPQDELASFL